ncbi:hypothetical protein [Thermobifida fusca]|uniref:hypothetical protein n=1 Tax=Thermobifida fusca TaxID=2021 RepID=UPI0012DFD2EC
MGRRVADLVVCGQADNGRVRGWAADEALLRCPGGSVPRSRMVSRATGERGPVRGLLLALGR